MRSLRTHIIHTHTQTHRHTDTPTHRHTHTHTRISVRPANETYRMPSTALHCIFLHTRETISRCSPGGSGRQGRMPFWQRPGHGGGEGVEEEEEVEAVEAAVPHLDLPDGDRAVGFVDVMTPGELANFFFYPFSAEGAENENPLNSFI